MGSRQVSAQKIRSPNSEHTNLPSIIYFFIGRSFFPGAAQEVAGSNITPPLPERAARRGARKNLKQVSALDETE